MKSEHILISVDCGLDGGIVETIGDIITKTIVMPTIMVAGRRELDINNILSLFLNADEIAIEEQFILQKQGNRGNFTIGKNYGILLALAITAVGRNKVFIYHPNTWQRGFSFPTRKTKKDHLVMTEREGLNTTHDGIADACLLGKYHRKIKKAKEKRCSI
jgi:hypothetical protein